MTLALTGEHLALAEAVRGWAGRAVPAQAVRDVVRAGDYGAAFYSEALRASLAGQGLLGLHVPEPAGGQGYALPELAVAAEELGHALLPGGFLPTVLASALLTAAGALAEPSLAAALKGLVDGSLRGAVGLADGLVASPAPDGGLVLDGSCGPVLGAGAADLLIVPAAGGEATSWAVLDAADVEVTPVEGMDLTRPAGRLRLQRLTVPADRLLPGATPGLAESLAAVLFAAEASGIAAWAVETAAGYAKIRQQFGRPIGQFQAVKHRCARMLAASEQAAAAAWDAARAQQGDSDAPGRELAAAAAAVVSVDAAVTCAHECIQVLGGIGYTWEHDAHLYYRRALSLRAMLGRSSQWAQRAARLALAGARRPAGVDLPAEADQVRAGVRAELASIAAAPSAEHARLLAEGGWAAPHLPRPWGRDASALEQLVVSQEMTAAGLRAPALMIGAWVLPALVQYGTAEQQQRFLPPTLRGEILWCQLFSEPGAGSDLAGLATRAERADGGWRISGQKIWTSLARQAAWAICIARTDPSAARHDGITYFLVDMSSPGIEVRPLREMTGEALFNEVFLDGVFVPDEQVVGEVNGGWRVARTTLANERVSLSQSWTFGCGVAELLQSAQAAGADRDPALLAQVGHMVCEGHAIDVLGLRVARKRLSGTDPGATGSVRKLLSMRFAQQVAEDCWAMAGPDGAVGADRWSRAVLFTRALTIGGGTTDIQLNIIGERVLGLPRDPLPGA